MHRKYAWILILVAILAMVGVLVIADGAPAAAIGDGSRYQVVDSVAKSHDFVGTEA